jgi:hypothetical protein
MVTATTTTMPMPWWLVAMWAALAAGVLTMVGAHACGWGSSRRTASTRRGS